jgi:hypothetical protein
VKPSVSLCLSSVTDTNFEKKLERVNTESDVGFRVLSG